MFQKLIKWGDPTLNPGLKSIGMVNKILKTWEIIKRSNFRRSKVAFFRRSKE
jgi:hypothetical protein